MKNLIVNYALASAIFEEKKNFLDTYFPFVLRSFENCNILILDELAHMLTKNFCISLPIHSLKDIIRRKKDSIFHINRKRDSNWEIQLGQQGREELNAIIYNEKKVESQINSFYFNFVKFSDSTFGIKYEIDKIGDLVSEFINLNLFEVTNNAKSPKRYQVTDDFSKHFVSFLAFINQYRIDLTEIFEAIWKGTIIWKELRKADTSIQQPLKFKKELKIFVDTNFVFSLLDFHNPIICGASKELFGFLNTYENVSFNILDITVKEILDILDLYSTFKADYYNIEVDTVFYYLKKKNYSLADVAKLRDELITNLEKRFNIQLRNETALGANEQKWYVAIFDTLFQIRDSINSKKPEKTTQIAECNTKKCPS